MPNVFLLSYRTGEFEVAKELLESHVKEALSGEMKIVDVNNLNFLNSEGEWEEIQGKEEIEIDEEEIYSFKQGARRCIDPEMIWAYCKQKF